MYNKYKVEDSIFLEAIQGVLGNVVTRWFLSCDFKSFGDFSKSF